MQTNEHGQIIINLEQELTANECAQLSQQAEATGYTLNEHVAHIISECLHQKFATNITPTIQRHILRSSTDASPLTVEQERKDSITREK